ncbi:MAG: adenylate kinase [Acidimicrobiales bacterium]|nr:MAG: adenylate kinase [Acidimicrobiales bacterium]
MSSSSPLRLVVFGRQGSGKGTQCKLLAERRGIVHVSTGDMLREAVSDDSALGRRVREYVEAGDLVPDELVIELVTDRLGRVDAKTRGWVLDGFPRTLEQAEALLDAIRPDGITLAIELVVPVEVVVERMKGRGRSDDTEEAIRRRLELYERETVPAVEMFAAKGLLARVDGVGTVDEIAERVEHAIDERLGKVGSPR